jgi:hypothetical protein
VKCDVNDLPKPLTWRKNRHGALSEAEGMEIGRGSLLAFIRKTLLQ